MGVPTFFRWLTMRNPKIILDCSESDDLFKESVGPEIDNFYIDMNGLIHPSCNPQAQHNIRVPSNFEEQCQNVFQYVDRLMSIVRPKKLLYLAIDGVAPRAKMNQQRSRRFRAAKESLMNDERKKKLKQEYDRQGLWSQEVQDYVNKKSFDSNVITPGTEFLSNLSKALTYYVHDRMNNHPHWANLIVVFSDANCPGEGQHKVMQFIRQQRASVGYNPNQSHCLYGADADLIMLGLMTHEPLFYIIRETIMPADQKRCTICNQQGHFFMQCKMKDYSATMEAEPANINVNFQMIRLQLVRQQLDLHFRGLQIPYGYNIERIIDDFIFMCFFVGNDFLPHMPTLNIRDGGIDILMYIYECTLSKMPDYLIDAGVINYDSLEIFLEQLSFVEQRLIDEAIKRQSVQKSRDNFKNDKNERPMVQKLPVNNIDKIMKESTSSLLDKFKNQLKAMNPEELDTENYSTFSHSVMSSREKFYSEKFRILPEDFMEFRARISQAYLEALSWICLYYYRGVASWSWYYPFHYSPFASDLKMHLFKKEQFKLGQPFKPFEQLMAVLPPKTSWAVPRCLQPLMLDLQSPIADFFPTDFIIDTLGKKFAWLGQVLLPFIQEDRLLSALGDYEMKLTEDEKTRNRLGNSVVFYNIRHPIKRYITSSAQLSCSQVGLDGRIQRIIHSATPYPSPIFASWSDLHNNQVESAAFIEPENRPHVTRLLNGTNRLDFQIDQQYITKTDKRSYNGQRMIRMLESMIDRPRRTGPQSRRTGYDVKVYEYNDATNDYRNNMKKRHGEQESRMARQDSDRADRRNSSRSRSRDRRHREERDHGRHRQHHDRDTRGRDTRDTRDMRDRDNRDNRDNRDHSDHREHYGHRDHRY